MAWQLIESQRKSHGKSLFGGLLSFVVHTGVISGGVYATLRHHAGSGRSIVRGHPVGRLRAVQPGVDPQSAVLPAPATRWAVRVLFRVPLDYTLATGAATGGR